MHLKAFWIVVLAAISAANVSANEWRVDKGESSIRFHGTQTGKPFSGVFEEFEVHITYDPTAPEKARIHAKIHTASAKTGDSQRDEAMPQKDWFFVKNFPVATFEAHSFIEVSPNNFKAEGLLSLRGIEQKTLLPFSLNISGDTATAKGTLSLDRSDFGVGSGPWAAGKWVGLDVKVDIAITAVKIETTE